MHKNWSYYSRRSLLFHSCFIIQWRSLSCRFIKKSRGALRPVTSSRIAIKLAQNCHVSGRNVAVIVEHTSGWPLNMKSLRYRRFASTFTFPRINEDELVRDHPWERFLPWAKTLSCRLSLSLSLWSHARDSLCAQSYIFREITEIISTRYHCYSAELRSVHANGVTQLPAFDIVFRAYTCSRSQINNIKAQKKKNYFFWQARMNLFVKNFVHKRQINSHVC